MQRSHSQEVFLLKDRIVKLEDFIQERLLTQPSNLLWAQITHKLSQGKLDEAFSELLDARGHQDQEDLDLLLIKLLGKTGVCP